MEKKIILFVVIALFAVLCACSTEKSICPQCSNKVDFSSQSFCANCGMAFSALKPDGYEESEIENTHPENINNGVASYTLNEASETGGVFVKKGDKFYPISNYRLRYTATSMEYLGCSDDDVRNIAVLDLSGDDLLVTFDPVSSYDVHPVFEMFYCFPVPIANVNSNGILYSGYGATLEREYAEYTTEIDNQGFSSSDELEAILKQKNCFLFEDYICSGSPALFYGGYYSGTKFTEYEISVSADICFFPDDISLSVERTKDGYFIIDTTQLETGKYVINAAPGNIFGYLYYVFEVMQ